MISILFALVISMLAWTGFALANTMPPVSGVISVATEPVTIKTTSVEGKAVNRTVGVGQPIYLNDEIKTGPNNKLQILLKDQTVFNVGPNSVMTIDKFVFDPTKGELSVGIQKGAFKFVSGKVSNSNPDAMKVKLPNATISVRGTGVAGNVAPDGASTVVLLHGVVDVAGAAGTSTLSKSGWGVQVAPSGIVGQPTVIPLETTKGIMGSVAAIKAPEAVASTTTTSASNKTANSSSSTTARPSAVQSAGTENSAKPATTTSASSSPPPSASSNSSVYSMPNNEAAKDAAGIVATNSLQSSVMSSESSGASSSNFSSKNSGVGNDVTTIKSTLVSTTGTSQATYMRSIIPQSYLSYLQGSGIDTTELDLNTVDLNSDLGRQLIALKQAYEIATGTASPSPSPSNNTDPNTNSSSSSGGADAYLASSYPGLDDSAAAAIATLEASLNTSSLMSSYLGKSGASAYDLNAFKTASMGNLGTYVFNLNSNTQAMGCNGGGTACGASGTLESQVVTINYATANISNSYRVAYTLGSPTGGSALTGFVAGSGNSPFASLTGSGKAITLPVDSSHAMLKMLGTFAPPVGNNQYANFKAAIALANPSTPGANVTIATPTYVINGIKQ